MIALNHTCDHWAYAIMVPLNGINCHNLTVSSFNFPFLSSIGTAVASWEFQSSGFGRGPSVREAGEGAKEFSSSLSGGCVCSWGLVLHMSGSQRWMFVAVCARRTLYRFVMHGIDAPRIARRKARGKEVGLDPTICVTLAFVILLVLCIDS